MLQQILKISTLILMVSSCAPGLIAEKRVPPEDRLSPEATAYVNVPEDGKYGNTVYPNSGLTIARLVSSAFARNMSSVKQSEEHEKLEEALLSAKKINTTYLIFPEITHWEDRHFAWSSRMDKVQIKISIYDVVSQGVLQRRFLWARGGGAMFTNPKLGSMPLLTEIINSYADSLF